MEASKLYETMVAKAVYTQEVKYIAEAFLDWLDSIHIHHCNGINLSVQKQEKNIPKTSSYVA